MKLSFLIITILLFEIVTTGCRSVSKTETSRPLKYTVTVITRENEITIPVITNVFMKFGMLVVSMQTLYTAQQQVEYRLTCRSGSIKQLNELRDELLSQADVLKIDIERTY